MSWPSDLLSERWRGALLAVTGGAAWGACHGIGTKPLLALVALAPFAVLLGHRRAGWLGWLHGAVAWGVAIPWIVPTLTDFGLISGWLAGIGLLLLAAFLGLYDAAFAVLGARLWRRGDALSLAALPALWVALEVARGRLFSGFPWNLAAYAWVDLPGALPLSSWTGAWGVSYLVVLANVLVAAGVARRRWQPALLGLLLPLTLLPIAARFATLPDPPGGARLARVVQPDIPNRPFFDAAATAADYARLLATSHAACEPGVLLLWPESAAWPRNWQDDVQLRLDLQTLVRERGCALLFNTAFDDGGRTYNSVMLVESAASGPPAPEAWAAGARAGTEGLTLQRADKRHLVPFGEYVPLRRWLPFVGKIARMVGDFSPAAGISLLDWRGERLGAAVCYEVVFPGETAALVAAGATALVTVTNDGWYGDSAAPRQHLRAARFRAAENRRWLLRAAVTGISAVVRPDGSLEAFAEVGEERVLTARFIGRADRSPFSRVPWLVPALLVALATVALARARRHGAGDLRLPRRGDP
jgi:apolipoprotein N-acyltransferase